MSEIEIVERRYEYGKRNGVSKNQSKETIAFLGTLETGKAIRVSLNGTGYNTLRNRFRAAAKTRGLCVHVRSDGPDFVIAWAEKRR